MLAIVFAALFGRAAVAQADVAEAPLRPHPALARYARRFSPLPVGEGRKPPSGGLRGEGAPASGAITFTLFDYTRSAVAAPNAEKSVEMLRRDGEITILPNGDVHIVETWEVHFIGGPFTHAFREIPFKHVEAIVNWQVAEGKRVYTEGGGEYSFEVENRSDSVRISWRFPPTTDAIRTFTVSYTLKGALWIGDQSDSFHWAFIEPDHGYPIKASSVRVHLPAEFAPTQISTTAGPSADEKSGAGKVVSGNTVIFSQNDIEPYEDWVIGVKWPHGAVNASPPNWEREALRRVEMPARTADFTILPNGNIRATETWQVKFVEGPFDEATRTYKAKFVDAMTDFSVAEGPINYRLVNDPFDLAPRTFLVQRLETDDSYALTWDFPKTYNASRTFTISYTLKGAVNQGKTTDEFAWVFVSDSHDYPIQHAEVVFHLPAAFNPKEIQADSFIGSLEGEPTAHGEIVDGETVRFTAENLAPNQQWGVRVRWPHGAINAPIPAWERLEHIKPWVKLGVLAASLLMLVFGIGSAILLWYLFGRDPAVGAVPKFIPHPPDKLPAGIVGVLVDEYADLRDITTATLLDLARRGYLQIITSRSDTRVKLLKSADEIAQELRPYEAKLLNLIFGSGLQEGKEVNLSSLQSTFFPHLKELSDLAYKEVVKLGLFPVSPDKARRRYRVLAWAAAILLVLASCVAMGFVPSWLPGWEVAAWWVSVVATAVAYFVIAPHMPRKTKKGAVEAAKWEAFKRYLESLRKYTVWDREAEQVKAKLADYLPYAIVFGLKHSFNDLLKRAKDVPAPPWYRPVFRSGGSPTGSPTSGLPAGSKGLAMPAQGGAPSLGRALNSMSEGAFTSLSQISDQLFDSLESASRVFTAPPPSSSGSSSSWSGGGGSSWGGSGWSGGGDWGGGFGGAGGGGSSGFG